MYRDMYRDRVHVAHVVCSVCQSNSRNPITLSYYISSYTTVLCVHKITIVEFICSLAFVLYGPPEASSQLYHVPHCLSVMYSHIGQCKVSQELSYCQLHVLTLHSSTSYSTNCKFFFPRSLANIDHPNMLPFLT